MHVFRHPKYYEEFRQRSKRAQLNKKNDPSLKQQATSVKPQAASDKRQAASSKQQASSLKPKV